MDGERGKNDGMVWEKCGPSGRTTDRSVPICLPLGPLLTGGSAGLADRLARWLPTNYYGISWVPLSDGPSCPKGDLETAPKNLGIASPAKSLIQSWIFRRSYWFR